MFYDVAGFNEGVAQPAKRAFALVAMTPAESKRLIAKGVAQLPEVKQVLKKGTLLISRGTTNAFVAEEVLGISISKSDYTAGIITEGELRATSQQRRLKPYVIRDGKVAEVSLEEAWAKLEKGDVVLKGANALDPAGNIGVLVGSDVGGTVGQAMPVVLPRGCAWITPVGLEKMVPSVIEASRKCDIYRYKYSTGLPCALLPFVNTLVVTEIQALKFLTGVDATHVASGGIGGSEGAVVLALEGVEENIDKAYSLITSIKGEASLPEPVESRGNAP